MDKKCEFIKNGQRCRAYKITNSKYCFTHSDDPKIMAMREEALKKAADSHKLYLPISQDGEAILNLPSVVDLGKSKGIKRAYIILIKAAAQGGIDERRLGALVYALNGYCSALEKLELFEKIERLERMLIKRGDFRDEQV